jgi:Type II secretion system (T2SS), protein F
MGEKDDVTTMTSSALGIAVPLLAAAAVLVWPGSWSATVSSSGAVTRDVDGAAPACPDRGGELENPEARPGRMVVPVAEVAGVIDLLALTLRGGVGLVEAMEAVAARVGGPLGMHLSSVAAAGRWGVDDATAWECVPSAWQPAARALRMAAMAGVPPADALAGAAEEVRRAEQQRLEVATATLGIRIVLPLGLLFLPAFILTTVMPIVIALAHRLLVGQ